MIGYFIGALVSLAFVALLGAWHERGQRINAMQLVILDYAARADKSEKSEKDLRMMIEGFNGRPFHIGLNDAQILTLAQMIVSAFPFVKETHIQ